MKLLHKKLNLVRKLLHLIQAINLFVTSPLSNKIIFEQSKPGIIDLHTL